MARTNYIAGNWKMNTTKEQAVALASDLVAQLKGKTNKYMIGVPFVYLDAVAQVVKGSNIILAAQDCAATDRKALNSGLEVDLCIGEVLSEREAGEAEQVCAFQLSAGLAGVTAEQMKNVTIAYEPVWAIGTGKTATPEDAQAIHKFIRGYIAKLYNQEVADNVIIQYGGSMNQGNCEQLLAQPDIDGGLIGGASLKAETFVPICSVGC